MMRKLFKWLSKGENAPIKWILFGFAVVSLLGWTLRKLFYLW
ncbi:MAG: hypothetical protein WBG90_18470 [Saonia sp.]